MPARRWTDQQLRDAIETCTTWAAVPRQLGLRGPSDAIRNRCDELGLDTSHWDRPVPPEHVPRRPRRYDWSDAQVRAAAEGARSVRQVMRSLGLDPMRHLGRRAAERRLWEVGINPVAMPGQAWSAGTRQPRRHRKPLADILVTGRPIGDTHRLKLRLVEEGILAWCCAICGIDTWHGQPLSLHLDHVNGDRRDNRLENLRLLCPNCHSQTPTYCGKNVQRDPD